MIQQILQMNPLGVKRHYHKCLGIHQELHVLEMHTGHLYIQTVELDDIEDIITSEMFFCDSRESDTMLLLERARVGEDHHAMRSYPRDSHLPVRSHVRVFS